MRDDAGKSVCHLLILPLPLPFRLGIVFRQVNEVSVGGEDRSNVLDPRPVFADGWVGNLELFQLRLEGDADAHSLGPLKLKSLDAGGTFTGIAATYNGLDMVGDTIVPEAFKQAIAQQGADYPLLFAHDQSQPLGVGKISDSTSGLVVTGSLVLADPNAVRAQAHMRAGSIKGLSIGYTVPDGKSEIQRDGTRVLKEIKLHEISLVAVPADPGAMVTSVKDAAGVLANVKVEDLQAEDRAVLLAAMKRLLGKDLGCMCDCPECLAGNCAACSNADCTDPNCEGSQAQAETLSALRALAAELRAA